MFKKFILASLLFIVGAVGSVSALYYYRDQLPVDIFSKGNTPSSSAYIINVPVAQTGEDFALVVNSVSPSVVNISTLKVESSADTMRDDPLYNLFDDFFSPQGDPSGARPERARDLGSGLIVSTDGYILTSAHVVANSYRIQVTLYDRRVFEGKLIGADPKTDLAVIKIDATELQTIPWGDSDKIDAGQFVLAIGNPFGLSHSITMGIISAVGRANVGIAEFEDFIQTDAAINPGNSGGPLVNQKGQLVGINTAIFTKTGGYQGIGFAVPVNMARLIMAQLIKHKRVVRGWLGLSMQELSPGLAKSFGHTNKGGALVSDTLRGSPAHEAGIISGDIITDFNGQPIMGHAEMKRLVAMSAPDKKVTILFVRNGKKKSKTIVIGQLKQTPLHDSLQELYGSETDAFAGLSVIALTTDISSQLNLVSDTSGVVVAALEPGTPTYDAGVKRGDLIESIDKQPISSVSQFRKISNSLVPGHPVLVLLNRAGKRFYMTITTEQPDAI